MLIAGAWIAWPAGVAAQEIGVVVYAPRGAPEPADRLRDALVGAAGRIGLRAESRPFGRARAMLAAGAVPAERLDGFARVERLVAEGWRGYLEARFDAAAVGLGEARAEAAALLDLAGGLELYADVLVRIGAVELALGRDAEAGSAFRLAARLDPDRVVSDAEFKPAVVARYAGAGSAVGPRWRRRFEIDPPGAALEIDGRPSGSSPVEVELDEGPHIAVARAPGRAARADLVLIGPGAGEVIRWRLAEEPLAAAALDGDRGLPIGQTPSTARASAEALVAIGHLDGLLVAASIWRGGRRALLGQLCRGPALGCGRAAEVVYGDRGGLDEAAARLWREVERSGSIAGLTLLADARLVHRELGPAVAGAGGETSDRAWWRNRWVWVGVGGVALSAAAAAVIATSGGDPDPWAPVFDPCEFGGC